MARVRSKALKANRDANKAARVASVRAAPETTTMAAAAAVSVDKPLTDKQKAYALARARGESVPNAMATAGYNETPSYGYRMEKMPNVRRAIQEEQALYAEAAQITRKKVIDMQLEAFDLARTLSEPATMVSAAREIGKICGLYEPQKIDITHGGVVQVETARFERMTDAELAAFIANSGQGASAQPPELIEDASE